MKRIERGGDYYRVCKPDWTDCGDTAFSLRGGRWNPPDAFRVLYLNRTIRMAALQALENFRGEAHGLFDLRPDRRPDLQRFDVRRAAYVDAVTEDGLAALGLSASYPEGVGWDVCQPIGRQAFDAGEAGIACRTAIPDARDPDHEELALFDRGEPVAAAADRLTFDRWFPSGGV